MVRHDILMAGHLYNRYVRRLPSRAFLDEVNAETGAAGANRAWAEAREGWPNVRRQELGELLVSEGLTEGTPERMRLGIRALSFGMGLQDGDGSFPGPEEGGASYGATAFFLGSACGALLMLGASSHPAREKLAAEWRPSLARAASWLGATPPDHPELANYACAAAAAAAGVAAICEEAELWRAARQLCQAACELQRPDGSWPERGGSDSLYQAVSLIYATYAFVICNDEETRDKLGAALDRGFGWLAERIGEDGSVDCRENTRKSWGRRPDDNEVIFATDFVAVSYALRTWGSVTGEPRWRAIADRVDTWTEEAKPGGDRNVWEVMASGRR